MAAENPPFLVWSRDGLLKFPWTPFETLESLTLPPALRERLTRASDGLKSAEESSHAQQQSWRRGLMLYGPAGSGKSAVARAVARHLGWTLLTIPAYEILDAHFLERAFSETAWLRKTVVLLEDIDVMIRRMETSDFFALLDHVQARMDGAFWIATSRHAEEIPKTQLIRPGRFDEAIRLEFPSAMLRAGLLKSLARDDEELDRLVGSTENFSYAHFRELRSLELRLRSEGRSPEEIQPELESYLQDQLIAGDRTGGLSDATEDLNERVKNVDPRMLMAALDVTDVFKRVIEKTLGDAAEAAKQISAENG